MGRDTKANRKIAAAFRVCLPLVMIPFAVAISKIADKIPTILHWMDRDSLVSCGKISFVSICLLFAAFSIWNIYKSKGLILRCVVSSFSLVLWILSMGYVCLAHYDFPDQIHCDAEYLVSVDPNAFVKYEQRTYGNYSLTLYRSAKGYGRDEPRVYVGLGYQPAVQLRVHTCKDEGEAQFWLERDEIIDYARLDPRNRKVIVKFESGLRKEWDFPDSIPDLTKN